MRGKTSRTVMAGGLHRTYIVYLPQDVDPKTPIPLVIVAHGYTMSGQNMYDITDYPALADQEHIAVAFPDGQSGPNSIGAPCNVGCGFCNTSAGAPPVAPGDDNAFIDAMKADIADDQCLDAPHEFFTGFSMGGYLSHQVACTRDDFRGIAPHSGGTHDLSTCTSQKHPIIIFHGDSDAVVPPGCDDPTATGVLGTDTASALAWARRNGCAETVTTRTVDNGECDDYDGCPTGAQVSFCRFNDMGHCWAGGPSGNIYSCNGYASATQLEWAFWKQYAW
jgi:polyhydroxybutyrate depolymerase